jgi:glycosyltransferase involved in cell wall biosynthesis
VSYRILYHHRTQALDGQRVHIREVQAALRELGHDVIEVAPVRSTQPAGASAPLTGSRRLFRSLTRWAPPAAYECLGLAYNVAGVIALLRTIRRCRPDFIYERHALNTVAGVWASRLTGVPLLLEVNSPLVDEQRELGRLVFRRTADRLERCALRGATRVLAVTRVLQHRLCDAYRLEPGRVVIVSNGVDPDRFAPVRVREPESDHPLVIGSVGFFREWHGIDLLIRCLHDSPLLREHVRVLLIGDGPAVNGLKMLASTLGVRSRVTFAGAVRHDEVPQRLAEIDAVLLPRAVPYASPLKLFEYMAAGKPLIVPRQPNLLETITEEHDALCFTPGDEGELLVALERLVVNTALRRRLAMAARATIVRRGLTWRAAAARIIDAYESAVPHPRHRRRDDAATITVEPA